MAGAIAPVWKGLKHSRNLPFRNSSKEGEAKSCDVGRIKSQEPRDASQLSPIGIRQQLAQTGFVLVFPRVLLVLHTLYRWRCPQHSPRRGFYGASGGKFLKFFLLRHHGY